MATNSNGSDIEDKDEIVHLSVSHGFYGDRLVERSGEFWVKTAFGEFGPYETLNWALGEPIDGPITALTSDVSSVDSNTLSIEEIRKQLFVNGEESSPFQFRINGEWHEAFGDTIVSVDDAAALVRATFSDYRPDPNEPQELVSARFERFCGDRFNRPTLVLYILQYPEDDDTRYEWAVEEADYLRECVSEERFATLHGGAEPTNEEREWFEAEKAQEVFRDECRCEMAEVHRIAASFGGGESHAVFFCNISYAMDRGSPSRSIGPLRDAAEVETALAEVIVPPFDIEREGNCPELADFIQRLDVLAEKVGRSAGD